jgi:tRNA-dihydrouridine synthase B
MKQLKLGSLVMKNIAVLSPLESVSDIGFRRLCYAQGASMTWTEMVRGDALYRKNQATLELIDTYDPSTLTGLQLLVKNADGLLSALHRLEELAITDKYKHFNNIAAIDLNFGCPSPDVIREGAGPSLLKRRSKLYEIFNALSAWKKTTTLPNIGAVGCKIRLGLNQNEQDLKIYLPVVTAANESGLDYVTVHARHAKQRSRDLPTWAAIGEIKNISTIPIIGNGDVKSIHDAEQLMKQSNCDGVMIARAAIQNPWMFRSFNFSDNNNSSSNIHSTNDSSVFPSGSMYIPTTDEVIHAREEYEELSKKYNSKTKYQEFHHNNFNRIMKICSDHNKPINNNTSSNKFNDFYIPKNIHLS